MHEFIFAAFDENKCNIKEFVNEMNAPVNTGDICDIHYEYHQTFTLRDPEIVLLEIDKVLEVFITKESYKQKITQDLIIPPVV